MFHWCYISLSLRWIVNDNSWPRSGNLKVSCDSTPATRGIHQRHARSICTQRQRCGLFRRCCNPTSRAQGLLRHQVLTTCRSYVFGLQSGSNVKRCKPECPGRPYWQQPSGQPQLRATRYSKSRFRELRSVDFQLFPHRRENSTKLQSNNDHCVG